MNETRGLARLGVLIPFTNTNLEPDFAMACPAGVSCHYTRIGGYDIDAVPDEHQMSDMGEAPLDEALSLLAGAKPDVVIYGCTSATLTHGPMFDQELSLKIQQQTGAETVTAAGALVTALQSLKVKRIGFSSPYVKNINDEAISFLTQSGFDTVSRMDIALELGNHGQGELSPDDIYDLALRTNSDEAEAIILSCTDMRSMEVINRLEDTLRKPVITSNQAMLYAALSKINIDTSNIKFGSLFTR